MKREDFIFCVGYMGETALVDKKQQKKYAKLSTGELAEKGFLKPAFCSALYSGESDQATQFLEAYARLAGSRYDSLESLKKVFGVFDIPQNIKKIKYI